MKKLRMVFMGTPDFAVPSLKKLYDAGYDIAAVVTQTDKERGRGKKVSFSPVKECAIELGIPVLQPKTLKDEEIQGEIKRLKPDVIIVIAYGKILPKALLDAAPYGCLNVHGSLLPAYRGAAPIQHAIYDGVRESGVTIMMLDEGMDTGNILKEAVLPLDEKETTGSLFEKLSLLGAETLLPVLADLEAYEANSQVQDEGAASYTQKITKEMAAIDWNGDAAQIERLIRTLDPQPGAYTLLDGKRLKIWSADVVEGKAVKAGTIIEVTKKYFTVQTGQGALKIREVQPESRKRITAAQFLQGISLQAGMELL